ncbi:PilZ domain-containing protein [Sphingomonas immobilis]|uniref:PilZ domain-containing protein n=1 Tax=Sphingomonas immobilis TaxID=3063997 RepID=A0ABT8ZUH9_9SPHN|nr:PilZ domain-containing protein [Sphingomonas sp. CA1-15]MDO7841231.1 PilZ domain-containing protein [Sphingomonas sp. CA1-15]
MTAFALRRPEPRIIPRAPRHDVDVAAEIAGPTILPFSSRVKNISTSGMLLLDSGQLQVGDVVYAKLPGRAPVLCVVARLRPGGGAGIKFETSVQLDDCWG